MRGEGGVAGEGKVVVPKFRSWGKCTIPLTNINSYWMSNASPGLCINLFILFTRILYFASWGVIIKLFIYSFYFILFFYEAIGLRSKRLESQHKYLLEKFVSIESGRLFLTTWLVYFYPRIHSMCPD